MHEWNVPRSCAGDPHPPPVRFDGMIGDMSSEIIERAVLVGLVIVLAVLVRMFLVFVIRRATRTLLAREAASPQGPNLTEKTRWLLARASGLADERRRQRVGTLGSLLRNVVDVVIVTVTILTVLAIVGVPMTPLLASAGVGGVAVGFGAQSLVKDYISGIFMLAEDQFGIGDYVKVGDIEGTVLQVSLRVTQLRDPSGAVWYVRNGEILKVGNVSQGFSNAFVDVPVAIDEDPAEVTAILREAVAGMDREDEWSDVLLEPPSVLGVSSMSEGTMMIQIMLQTGANKQWAAMREVRLRAKHACAEAGIKGPKLQMAPTED